MYPSWHKHCPLRHSPWPLQPPGQLHPPGNQSQQIFHLLHCASEIWRTRIISLSNLKEQFACSINAIYSPRPRITFHANFREYSRIFANIREWKKKKKKKKKKIKIIFYVLFNQSTITRFTKQLKEIDMNRTRSSINQWRKKEKEKKKKVKKKKKKKKSRIFANFRENSRKCANIRKIIRGRDCTWDVKLPYLRIPLISCVRDQNWY